MNKFKIGEKNATPKNHPNKTGSYHIRFTLQHQSLISSGIYKIRQAYSPPVFGRFVVTILWTYVLLDVRETVCYLGEDLLFSWRS